MNINELRINNLISHNGLICTVEIINSELNEIYFLGKDFYYSDKPENLEGVPLTEERLLKFGFKSNINKDSGCGHSIFSDFNLWIDNGKIIYWKVKGSVELKHVHQIQNLYFDFTNEELTLNK